MFLLIARYSFSIIKQAYLHETRLLKYKTQLSLSLANPATQQTPTYYTMLRAHIYFANTLVHRNYNKKHPLHTKRNIRIECVVSWRLRVCGMVTSTGQVWVKNIARKIVTVSCALLQIAKIGRRAERPYQQDTDTVLALNERTRQHMSWDPHHHQRTSSHQTRSQHMFYANATVKYKFATRLCNNRH